MRFEISEILQQEQVMNLVFGNYSLPKNLLGRHYVSNGQVITAYHPDAVSMRLIDDQGQCYEMDQVERQPIFALFLATRNSRDYKIEMSFANGNTFLTEDPYNFDSMITKAEEKAFLEGEWLNSYEKMGAHPCVIDGVEGTYFAVWAPSAKRVSVVGDFNFWNGMQYPMNRLELSGIYELFIPGVKAGARYRYEVKTMDGNLFSKIDPYGFQNAPNGGDYSTVFDIDNVEWDDDGWLDNRKLKNYIQDSVAICDIGKGVESVEEMREGFMSEGYTHILLSQNAGVIRQPDQKKLGDTFTQFGMFTPFYCGGLPDKFRTMISTAHSYNTGVLMEIDLEYFKMGSTGLIRYDGTSLYGYADARIGIDKENHRYRFCSEKPTVANYLISCLLFWAYEYHVDGFVFTNILHEGRLEQRIEFLEKAIRILKDADESIILIADDKEELHRNSYHNLKKRLGFDFYWNYSIKSNVDTFINTPSDRWRQEFYRLSLPVRKSKVEESVLLLNHRNEQQDMYDSANTDEAAFLKLSLSKLSIGFLLGMPGKKLWAYAEDREHPMVRAYRLDVLHLYTDWKALYEYDPVQTALEWINPMDAESGVITFVRKTIFGEADLLFICNFSNTEKKHFQIGVPKIGSYYMISNSDSKEYGGRSGEEKNNIVVEAERTCYDLKPFSIYVDIPAMTALIFQADKSNNETELDGFYE